MPEEQLATSTVFEQMLDDTCPTLELDEGYSVYRFESICMGWLVTAKKDSFWGWLVREVKAYDK